MQPLPPIMFPVKGVNRTFARSSQSEGTAYDMLNVLPFDGTGRLRGGQRPGTAKQYSSAIGSGNPILMLSEVTTAVNKAALATPLVDAFSYLAGDLNTTSAGRWQEYTGGSSGSAAISLSNWTGYFATTSTKIATTGVAAVAVNTKRASVLDTTAPVLGSVYSVTMQFSFSNMSTTPAAEAAVAIAVRVNRSSPSSGGYVQLYLTGEATVAGIIPAMSLMIPGSGSTLADADLGTQVFANDETHELRLDVSGNTFTAYLDGVQQIRTTTNSNATATGVGFEAQGSLVSLSTGTAVVDSIIISPTRTTYRQTNLVAVSNTNLYIGDLASLPLATNGTTVFAGGIIPSIAYSLGKAYLVDGTSIIQADIPTKAVETYTATAGSAPTGCTLACVYRDRLVLAAPADNQQNFFCSRVGTHTDWDYGQSDPAAAFAGNASESGRIGEPITALIPLSDDLLIIGGDHNMWVMRGDPADGGSIDMMSDAIGVFGPNSWCKAPDGSLYFIGSGGLYKTASNASQPVPVSEDKWAQFFASIDRSRYYISMAWDRDRHGCFIFITNVNQSLDTHLWYDARTDGLFPLQLPQNHGPIGLVVYDGDGPDDRYLFMGGRDGYVRVFSPLAETDDGTGISSFVLLGPIQLGDGTHDGVIESVDVTYGEPIPPLTQDDWAATIEVQAGRDAYSVTEGTALHKFKVDLGRLVGKATTIRRRVRGAWATLKIASLGSGRHWSFENLIVTVAQGGKTRR